jgi:ribosomal protein S15P/S13E
MTDLDVERILGWGRAMTASVRKDHADEKELVEMISRLRSLAQTMRGLSGEQPDYREKLQKLGREVSSVGRRLRRIA